MELQVTYADADGKTGLAAAPVELTQKEKDEKEIAEDRKKIAEIKIGAIDSSGYKVTKIYCSDENSIVYEVESGSISDSIKVEFSGKAEALGKKTYEACWRGISHSANDVRAVLYKARQDTSSYKYLLASAIMDGITGDPEEGNKQLRHLEHRINKEYKRDFQSRTIFLMGNLTILLVVILMDIVVHLRLQVTPSAAFYDQPSTLGKAMMISFASIGGALSVAYSLGDRKLEHDLALWWLYLYGILRGVVALLCGIVVYFAIFGKFLPEVVTPLTNPGNGHSVNPSTIIVLMILAGSSETLVPSILNRIERDEKKKPAGKPAEAAKLKSS